MVERASFQTSSGVISAGSAINHKGSRLESDHAVENENVRLIHTAGGVELLVAVLVSSRKPVSAGGDQVGAVQQILFQAVGESRSRNLLEILTGAVKTANMHAYSDPAWRESGLAVVMAVLYDKRLVLAQVGNNRAYLVRGGKVFQISVDQPTEDNPTGATIPVRLHPQGSDGMPRYLGWDPKIQVESHVILPGGAMGETIELEPDDGIILGADGLVDQAMQKAVLQGEDFPAFFHAQPAQIVAEALAATTQDNSAAGDWPVVVLKNDAAAVPAAVPGSCMSQIGLITIILLISIGLGLGAAFGLPYFAGSKAVPVTAADLVKPGTISVLTTSGDAQVVYPAHSPEIIATGALLDAATGMQFVTSQGTAKIELADGTVVYVGNAARVTLVSVANPKLNQKNTVLELASGGILVDTTRLSGGSASLVTAPGSGDDYVTGKFLGVIYTPDQKRIDVDCLETGCTLSGTSASRNLAAGQHSWMINGVVGGLDAARYDLWAYLCDADCPPQAQRSGPVPQTTPTYAPTQQAPVPYLGAGDGGGLSTPGLIDSITLGLSNLLGLPFATATAQVIYQIYPTPLPTNGGGMVSSPVPISFTATPVPPSATATPTPPPPSGGGQPGGTGGGRGHKKPPHK